MTSTLGPDGPSAALSSNHTTTTEDNTVTPQDLMLSAAWTIQQVIGQLDAAGWRYEAECLSRNFDRSRALPDLLMVRDDAERLAQELQQEA